MSALLVCIFMHILQNTYDSIMGYLSWPGWPLVGFFTHVVLRSPRPGGWSSRGQPVDQLHGSFRRELQLAGAEDLKYFSDLTKRPSFKELKLSKSGQAKRTVEINSKLLECTLRAWQAVSPQCFTAAWSTCGYVSKDESINLQDAALTLDPSGLQNLWGAQDEATVSITRAKVPTWQILRNDEWANVPSTIASLGYIYIYIYIIYIYIYR